MNCLCVCLSSLCVPEPGDLESSWTSLWVWLCFGHGALTEALEGLSGTRQWGEIERALKRLWIPESSPLLTGSSSLLAPSQRLRWMGVIVKMDGSQLERQLRVATLAKQHQQGINWVMKDLGWQYEHERAYVCVRPRASVYLYSNGAGEEPERMRLVLKRRRRQGRLCLEIPAYMCQHYGCVVWERKRESKCETGHIGPCCVSKLWLIMASVSGAPPSQTAYCDPTCLELDSGYSCVRPPGLWEEHGIPSTDSAYWLLCQRPYYTIPLLNWRRFYSVCLRLCVKPTDDI